MPRQDQQPRPPGAGLRRQVLPRFGGRPRGARAGRDRGEEGAARRRAGARHGRVAAHGRQRRRDVGAVPVPRRDEQLAAVVPAVRVHGRVLPRQRDVRDAELEPHDVHARVRDVVHAAAAGLLPVRARLPAQGRAERRRVLPRQPHVRDGQLEQGDVHARVRLVVSLVVSARRSRGPERFVRVMISCCAHTHIFITHAGTRYPSTRSSNEWCF